MVFKSVDAGKQNPNNTPDNFTVKLFPELILDENKQHYLALDHLSMTASWHNIRPEYNNIELKISKDKGKTWETITFPTGIYDYEDINEFIHKRIGKSEAGINVLFDLTTFKVFFSCKRTTKLTLQTVETFMSCWDLKRKFKEQVLIGKTSQTF